jgi:CheY-like chemotaxis protein
MSAAELHGNRLNVLLTDFDEPWAEQLPRLLEPQGVRAIRVHDVDQAVEAIHRQPIHALVVDLALPMSGASTTPSFGTGGRGGRPETGGLKLLKVIQRLEAPPPTVVVRGRRFDRDDGRLLNEALRLKAFSVLDHPVQLEQLLEVFRRLMHRHYGGAWPQS